MFPNIKTLFLVLAVQSAILLTDAWTQNFEKTSRRSWLQQQVATAASVVTGSAIAGLPSPANAAAAPSASELEKLRKGHARVSYLLEHWDEETQICGKLVMSDNERKQVVRTEGEGFQFVDCSIC